MAKLLPITFHGDTLFLVEHNGEPFTAVKPICDAIGIDWKSQHAKLIGLGFRWGCHEIATTGADGKTYSMTCLPMRKLSGWLASISAAKVKPEIRDKLIAYQDECDDALWRYWTEGHASRPNAPASTSYGIPARPRSDDLPKLLPIGWQGERVDVARQQLEAAAGILSAVEIAESRQAKLDILTAAHMQCQAAALFITNEYDEVAGNV